MKCLNCGQENNNENMYCASCGKKLPRVEKICNNCNTINSSNSLYCKKCGNELSDAKEVFICVEEKKEIKKDNSLVVYQLLSIFSIAINFISSIFFCNILGLSAGTITLKSIKKSNIEEKKQKSVKVCSIIGIVISLLCITIKLVILIIALIQFLDSGEAPEVPDYSYFF